MLHEASWNSLRNRITPVWFQDAKFGIYTHWGIYSVPACGPNGAWYPSRKRRRNTNITSKPMDIPPNSATKISLSCSEQLYDSEIESVRMLGSDEVLPWKMTRESLKIKAPTRRPCDHAYVFKIERKHPF